MPRGRMINKKISQDEKIARLSIEATLLYTWCIPYLDLRGRLYGDTWTLKAIVPHVNEITPKIIERCIQEWVDTCLVLYYGNSQKYLYFKGFTKNQTLREDREAESEIPLPEQLPHNSCETPAQDKLSKDKLSKDKLNISKDNTMSGKPDLEAPILYLNEKAKRTFDPKNKSNLAIIKARYNESRTLDQFKTIIDKKVLQWLTSEKMMTYLRPSTLFSRTNFENYLNEPEQKGQDYSKLQQKFGLRKE